MNRSHPAGGLGGGGWRASSPDPQPGHFRVGKRQVLNAVLEMFRDNIDPSIIENVVQSCNYNSECATEALLSMCSDGSSQPLSQEVAHNDVGGGSFLNSQDSNASGLDVIRTAYGGLDFDSDVIVDDVKEEEVTGNPWQEVPSRGSSSKMYRITCNRHSPSSTRRNPDSSFNLGAGYPAAISTSTPFKYPSGRLPASKMATHTQAMKNVEKYIEDGMKILVLMRGCPGSGKSHFARSLILSIGGKVCDHVFSTDDFFRQKGSYVFRFDQLQAAHQWNQDRVLQSLRAGRSPIIVDNTHTMMWEMNAYAVMAVTNGYALEILEPPTPWFSNEYELAKRNSHNVPRDKIHLMLERYDYGVTVEKLLSNAGLRYSPSLLPPQPAVVPVGKKKQKLEYVSGTGYTFQQNDERPKTGAVKKHMPSSSSASTSDFSMAIVESEVVYSKLDATCDVPLVNISDYDTTRSENRHKCEETSMEPRTEIDSLCQVKQLVMPLVTEVETDIYCKGDEHVSAISLTEASNDGQGGAKLNSCIKKEAIYMSSDDEPCDPNIADIDVQICGSVTLPNLYDKSAHYKTEEHCLSDVGRNEGLMISKEAAQFVEMSKHQTSEESLQRLGESSKDDIEELSEEMRLISINKKVESSSSNSSQKSFGESSVIECAKDSTSLDFILVSLEPKSSTGVMDSDLTENPKGNAAGVSSSHQEVHESISNEDTWVMGEPWIDQPQDPMMRLMGSCVSPSQYTSKEQRERKETLPVTENNELPNQGSPKIGCEETERWNMLHDATTYLQSAEYLLSSKTESKEVEEWNVTDDASVSWQPIDKNHEEFYSDCKQQITRSTSNDQRSIFKKGRDVDCPVREASTNTHHSDFLILSNLTCTTDLAPGVKILNAFDRSINEGLKKVKKKIPLKLMLDKGTTIEYDLPTVNESKGRRENLKELIRLFPNVAAASLKDLLENCGGDVNWASNCLLDTDFAGLTSNITQDSPEQVETYLNSPEESEAANICPSNPYIPVPPVQQETPNKIPSESSKAKAEELKKIIEERIVMNEESYSPFVRSIKNLRRGIKEPACSEVVQNQLLEDPMPSFSSSSSSSSPSVPGVVSQGSPVFTRQDKSVEDDTEEDDDEDEEDSLEFILGGDFIQQLEDKFGPSGMWCSPNIAPVVKLPMALARQIHYHVVMSYQQQEDNENANMQLMCQRDEEIARQLYEEMQLQSKTSRPSTPRLREIMDMEMAQAIYRADLDALQRNSKDTMATVLAKRLLQDMFPKIDIKVLQDVLHAHNNSFEETVTVLQTSISDSEVAFSAEGRAQREIDLVEKAKRISLRGGMEAPATMGAVDINLDSPEEAMADAEAYREEAATLQEERRRCYEKAREAFQRGQRSVAAYYSQLGNLMKTKIDQANARAATAFVSAHALDKSPTTLDLHYLHVAEAVQVLDIFLDQHVTQLCVSGPGQEWLYIITGRGARSANGQSRIKPAVVRRLTERKIEYKVENPGLLKVLVTRNTQLACRSVP